MKKLFLLLIIVFIGLSNFAQAPQSFKYQSVVRNSSGDAMQNQAVDFRISILQTSSTGTPVYVETFSTTTNAFGLVNLEIGNGTVLSGTFSAINWGNDLYFMQVEIDPDGNGFQLMGVSQLLSVPYALNAANVNNSDTSITNELQTLSQTGTSVSLSNGGGTISIADNDNDSTNEIQAINFSNDTLYLSNGNSVYLGTYSNIWQQNGNNIYYNNGNVGIGTAITNQKLIVQSDATVSSLDSAIFEVRNKDGQVVFAVYQEGVRVYVDDTGTKGLSTKGGFAVGGFNATKSLTNEYLRVTPDSVRVYIEEGSGSKSISTKGGFAVGGFNATKIIPTDYFNISASDSAGTIPMPGEARVLWYPLKEAFLSGHVIIESPDSIGQNSFSTGYLCKAIGDYSQAFGYGSRSAGYNSTSFGTYVNAIGQNSMVFGDSSIARGYASYAFGTCGFDTATGLPTLFRTEANGDYSMSFGFGTVADSIGAITFGSNTAALGSFSFASGLFDTTYAPYSVAMGVGSTTNGPYSVSIGLSNKSNGVGSYAFGADNTSSGNGAYAIGYLSCSSGLGSYAIGTGDTASSSASVAIGVISKSSGIGAFAIGDSITATGDGSFAIGYKSLSSNTGSYTFGNTDTANAAGSFAIGTNCNAEGILSMALGTNTFATGFWSTSLGNSTLASGSNSLAMGYSTIASGSYSTAFGNTTEASGINSTVFGNNISVDGDYSFGINLGDGTTPYAITQDNSMAIMGGKVGIGTVSPVRALHIYSITDPVSRLTLGTNSGTFIEFWAKPSFSSFTPSSVGDITVNNGTVSYNAFTGSHLANINEEVSYGMLISLSGNNSYIDKANKTGEIIYGAEVSQTENSKNILGAYFNNHNDEDLVMAVGNGSMWVVDNGTDLKIGDYLISSSVKGHAVVDNGKYEISHIIARVAEPVNWENETKEINGVKHKLISVFFENFDLYHYDNKINKQQKEIDFLKKEIEDLKQILKLKALK